MTALSDIATGAIDRAVAIGVQQERNRLRLLVRSLPTYSEDGLWVRTQVERMLDEVATLRSGSDTSGGVPVAAKTVPGSEPTTAAAPTSAERRAAGTG